MKVLLLAIFPLLVLAKTNGEKLNSIGALTKIAFGSCNDQHREQVLWKGIISQSPQLFIWGGDNIYADADRGETLKKLYDQQNKRPEYKKLKEVAAIVGTWDDHDYGKNDADYFNPIKVQAQTHLLDFLDEPKDSKRRHREGVYASYLFGPIQRRVKVILLDARYHLNAPKKNNDVLGPAQWSWLEDELKTGKAKIHLIVSGFSVMSEPVPRSVEWIDYPKAHARLLKLLDETGPSGVVFLSGDKHFSSIYQNFGHLEFINSGMTHTAPWYLRWIASFYYPNIFFGRTFGQIQINWKGASPEIELKAMDEKGEGRLVKRYELARDGSWSEMLPTP